MNDNTTKNKIVATMYDLVAEKGYDKTSIGQISDSIGIKKASVYYYFKSKEEIFLQMVQELYEFDYSHKTHLFEDGISIAFYQRELISFGEALIDSYFENPSLRKVYAEIDLQTTRISALKEIAKTADENLNQFLIRCMAQGIEIGAFQKDFDTMINAQILYTILIGIDAAILYDLPVEPKAVWEGAILKLFNGKELSSQ